MGYTKKEFQIAYKWMFGETLKKGAEVYKNANKEYIKEVISAYRNNFSNSFYAD